MRRRKVTLTVEYDADFETAERAIEELENVIESAGFTFLGGTANDA